MRNATMFVMATLLAGCGAGSGEGLDVNGRPLDESGGDQPLTPTFGSIQANVFTPICTECHAGASAPLGLRLDAANSYALLVGQASEQVPEILRVAPNDPDNSYLIWKVEGTAPVGGQMPLGRPALPQTTIDVMRQWIIDGALPDDTPTDPGEPPTVVSLSPLPDSTVTALPAQILAIFSHELDASTVNDLSFTLVRSGGDGTFDDGTDVVIQADSVTLSLTNPTTATMDLGSVTSVDDVYRVTLSGAGPNVIMDLSANALDGEFDGTLPSGDGNAGGDFVSFLTVAEPPPPAGIQPTLASIQDNVFTPVCVVCHSGPPGPDLPAGMDLSDATASFNNLVGVPSLEVPSVLRVAPGDADNSYLVQKLEGTAAVGGQMPLGGPFLPQTTIDAVRQWIDDGASSGEPPPEPTAPPTVVSTSPQPDSVLDALPVEVRVNFSREIDELSVNDMSIVLVRSGGDGTFDDGNEVPIVASSVMRSPANAMAAVMDLNGVASVDDDYRVTVSGTGATAVRDLDGNALDGEFAGGFPSGDGSAGGDFVARFTVAAPPPPAGVEPTLASIQENVFTPVCVVCHSGPPGPDLPAGMDLSGTTASFNNLVGVPSIEVPSLMRVAPGDADNSYLVQKLEGTAAVGGQMPLGGPFLPQSTIDAVRQWISEGASSGEPPPEPTAPPTVVSMSPQPDSVLDALPAEVRVNFSREIDTVTVSESSMTLIRSGGDGSFTDGNEVEVIATSVSLSPSNPLAAVMDLSGVASVDDDYRLTVSGTGASAVLDLDGNALDGEFSGAFPSGDGSAGGDFVVVFSVVEPPPPVGIQPTLASIQENVFTPICAVCHSGPTGPDLPEGMNLSDVDASFAALIGVSSLQVPNLQRVNPGNAGSSYLVQKIEGTAAEGQQMPRGGPPLPQASIDAIRQWIDDGATAGGPPPDPTGPAVVTSTSQPPDGVTASLPAEITVTFSREIDAATVNEQTFTLTRSGGDGTFADGNEVAILADLVELSATDPIRAVMTLISVQSVDDVYRVRLSGSGAAVILDLDGNAIDGEFSGSFPSGDGNAGGDFTMDFTVSPDAELLPTLESIQSNVFTPLCASCHSGPSGNELPDGMDLSSTAASFASLVNIPSIQKESLMRVEPGDSDKSYLVEKLEPDPAEGGQMPLGGPPLPQATIDVIRAWIDSGANP